MSDNDPLLVHPYLPTLNKPVVKPKPELKPEPTVTLPRDISEYLVDVEIPVYREKGYIERTLENLTKQNLYQRGQAHIIVGEYKDAIDAHDDHVRYICDKYKHVTYMNVDKKGIAYARNYIIKHATVTNIVMNFDGDSIFNRKDALEHMIRPILDNEVLLTNCECILFDFDRNKPVKQGNIYSIAANVGNLLEKGVFARGPGLTVRKDAFYKVGGFRDVTVAEDYFLAMDICYEYSLYAKRFIEEVKILTSARRAEASKKAGFGVFDYSKNNYR